jgi:hypothetical protein
MTCDDQTVLVRRVRWREAQDARLKARARIGAPLSAVAQALLVYLQLLCGREGPSPRTDETMMDRRSIDVADCQPRQFTRKTFDGEPPLLLGRCYRSVE